MSKKTSILIVGTQEHDLVKNGKSSKEGKAEALMLAGYPIQILDEQSFYTVLYGG